MEPRQKDLDRFMSKIERQDNGCWRWTAGTRGRIRNGLAYGSFHYHDRDHLAHRVAWLFFNGYLPPKNLEVCHSCDFPPCVNPDHLFLGTHKDNMKDAAEKRRMCHGEKRTEINKLSINRGERHPCAKLKKENIPEILKLRSEGLSYMKIARRFNVSYPTIRNAALGKSWSCVNEKERALYG